MSEYTNPDAVSPYSDKVVSIHGGAPEQRAMTDYEEAQKFQDKVVLSEAKQLVEQDNTTNVIVVGRDADTGLPTFLYTGGVQEDPVEAIGRLEFIKSMILQRMGHKRETVHRTDPDPEPA